MYRIKKRQSSATLTREDLHSHVERQNLTMRMQIRRLTRLTNGFSKKWENLWAALCLHFAYYNFCRIHRTIHVTPAMESGITSDVWMIAELLSGLFFAEMPPASKGSKSVPLQTNIPKRRNLLNGKRR